MKQKIDTLDTNMKEVKSDIKVIKATVTDLSSQVNDHGRRITRLEVAQ